MSVKLFPDTKYTGTEVSFTPNGDVSNDTVLLQFPVMSIKNDTDYCIIISGPTSLNAYFVSIDDTKNQTLMELKILFVQSKCLRILIKSQ